MLAVCMPSPSGAGSLMQQNDPHLTMSGFKIEMSHGLSGGFFYYLIEQSSIIIYRGGTYRSG